MVSSPSRTSPLTTNDVREYLTRQSAVCDSRIQAAYMKLSARQGRSGLSSSMTFESSSRSDGQETRRPRVASLSRSVPSFRGLAASEDLARPSTAQKHRPIDGSTVVKPRGILKKPQSSTAPVRKRSEESPDAWFQRVMQAKQLSPMDLCELFSYGDARKHPLVPLSHVCEVLFDLDPDSANGSDPVTEEMEDFLYQFATEERGSIVLNVREALRALDIWQSRVVSSGGSKSPTKLKDDSLSKAIVLESKNKKLLSAISSLQDANLRLNRQLESSTWQLNEGVAPPAWSPRSRAAVAARVTSKSTSIQVSPVKSAILSSSTALSSSKTVSSIVNRHEKELVIMANALQYTGVKQLEDLLTEADNESTGFVSLKHLCWLLTDRFRLEMGETRLLEVCMGMTFNPQAQLDYKEFVNVLLDILIYALPNLHESTKQKSLNQLENYLQSGFPPGREGVRHLLDELCAKYDSENTRCISMGELLHVFHVDLVQQHAFKLQFPLSEQETLQLAHPFVQRNSNSESAGGFLSYPELLDAIFGPFPMDLDPETTQSKLAKRVLQWEFWRGLRITLCGGNPLLEQKIQTQIGKILAKLDPTTTFSVSRRYFQRIFDHHISSEDMAVIQTALATSEPNKIGEDGPFLRYDVLLKLVFGSPSLIDDEFFSAQIRVKLMREEERLQVLVTDLMASHGAAHKLELLDFHDVFAVQAAAYPLKMVELLYLFGAVDDSQEGAIAVKTLRNFLSQRCWKSSKRLKGEESEASNTVNSGDSSKRGCLESISKLVAECCAVYDLERALLSQSDGDRGWISSELMVSELEKMLCELGIEGAEREHLKLLIQSTAAKPSSVQDRKSPSRGDIHIATFFASLFDWKAMIRAMELPSTLVEVKKAFETFDWDRNGLIRGQDWNKVWRLIGVRHRNMASWEVGVLQRRFPSKSREQRDAQGIDYARLLVFLLAFHQKQARQSLQEHVVRLFLGQFAADHHRMSTAEMEKRFRALDPDDKGYFNSTDLKTYLAQEWSSSPGSTAGSDLKKGNLLVLLENSDALASVMRLLAGKSSVKAQTSSTLASTRVTFGHFREFVSTLATPTRSSSFQQPQVSVMDGEIARVAPCKVSIQRGDELLPSEGGQHTISSLRALEITILEIASEFADSKGTISPTRAFKYFSSGSTSSAGVSGPRTSPSGSPVRSQSPGSPSKGGSRVSLTAKNPLRELEASTLDPLTPSRLKQLLQIHRHLDVSTYLLSQFFLHVGSPSKYFLELHHFARWVAPISVELQAKVRGVVRQMIVKGKGGGGKVDLDRFLAQLQRQLQDSPSLSGASELQHVPASLLLTKLHQLNISLSKQELLGLLHHFGMEGNLEQVDYALLLQRLYEFNAFKTVK